VHWLREVGAIERTKSGEWDLAGSVIEITEHHKAEEALKFSEEQIGKILKGADCMFWQAFVSGDPSPSGELGKSLFWEMYLAPSALYRRIFGKDVEPGLTQLWTEDIVVEWEQLNRASTNALIEDRPDYDQEFQVRSLGNKFYLREHVSIDRLGPNRWNLVGVLVDITKRREAELALAAEKERLAVTLRTMNDAVIALDANGSVLFMNRAAADMTQWDVLESAGHDVSEVCVLVNAVDSHRTISPFNDTPAGSTRIELPPQALLRRRIDGRMLLVESNWAPVTDNRGNRVGAVLVLKDITQRHRLEEKIQQAAKLESIGLLAGGIAHDFNNILTAILGNLTLLQHDQKESGENSQLVSEAIQATKRASELTLQLLTFAKGGDPVRKAVRLDEIVKEAASFANRGSGVRIEYEFPSDLWAADIDKAQISQVIQNLVINAIQAMPNGGSLRISGDNERVEAGVDEVLASGDYIRVNVADNGTGIGPENIGRIFEPYFTTKQHGHGLGLATVFSIVRRHGGRIDVASALNTGTAFTFWLPAAGRIGSESAAPTAVAIKANGGWVLFMDDEEPIVRTAERLIRRMGYEFESAPDGKATIERYRAAMKAGRRFDVVIMDLTVPGGMGGNEAISILRKLDPSIKAIVSSGYSNDPVMSAFRSHGFRGMVRKPYDFNELSSVISSVLAENP
jgi:PAS domain S-box-containing protein